MKKVPSLPPHSRLPFTHKSSVESSDDEGAIPRKLLFSPGVGGTNPFRLLAQVKAATEAETKGEESKDKVSEESDDPDALSNYSLSSLPSTLLRRWS